jgi:ATP-dependent Clp protease ATP-binding subunit ClpB
VLDDGPLTDNKGRTANFRNTIIIMTSNLGSDIIRENFEKILDTNKEEIVAKTKIQVYDLLKRTIRPEFLNRIDDVILFNKLDKDVMNKIIQIELNKLVDRLKEKNFNITFDKTIISRIAELNTQEDYGARPIKRIIQNLCEDFLSDEILKGTIKEKTNVTLKIKDEEIKIFKK